MNKETMEAALQLGISLGREDRDPSSQQKALSAKPQAATLAEAFRAASDFKKGLEALRDMKGSQFDFREEHKLDYPGVPRYDGGPKGFGPVGHGVYTLSDVYAHVSVRDNNAAFKGYTNAGVPVEPDYVASLEITGDFTKDHGLDTLSIKDLSKPGETERALTFMAQYAAKRGLTP